MSIREKLGRFARKPLSEKANAIGATLTEPMRMATRLRLQHARRLAKANAIDFRSGLGDSANLLYGLVRSMKPAVCVEIGSARGKSACYIGMALKENGRGKLYAIDPHTLTAWNDDESTDTFGILKSNISALGLDAQISIMRSTSEEASINWVLPIDLIFIDGDHSYDGVKRDWELFLPYINPFGVVVFHDTIWDIAPSSHPTRTDMGVPRFVDELRQRGYQVFTVDRDCGVSIVQPIIGGRPLRQTKSPSDMDKLETPR